VKGLLGKRPQTGSLSGSFAAFKWHIFDSETFSFSSMTADCVDGDHSRNFGDRRESLVVPVIVVVQVVFMHSVLVGCCLKYLAEELVAVVQTRSDSVYFLVNLSRMTSDFFKTRAGRPRAILILFIFRCHSERTTRCHYLRIVVMEYRFFLGFSVSFCNSFV